MIRLLDARSSSSSRPQALVAIFIALTLFSYFLYFVDIFHPDGILERLSLPATKLSIGFTADTKDLELCEYCVEGDEICKRYGYAFSKRAIKLARSRGHVGGNARLKRIIHKILSGSPVKIGVLGGSVTAGHGVSSTENWTHLLLSSLRALHPDTSIEIVNGAVPAAGSNYFETCFAEHIPSDVDLVILELSIIDYRVDEAAVSYENLVRALLQLEGAPAVINLQAMALMFSTITRGGDLHASVAQYYDLPHISVRNVLLPLILHNTSPLLASNFSNISPTPEPNSEDLLYWFNHDATNTIDLRHLGKNGHRLMSDLLVSFWRRTVCEVMGEAPSPGPDFGSWKPAEGDFLPTNEIGEYLPRMTMFQKFDLTTVTPRFTPTCFSISSTLHPLTPLPNLSKGFEKWSHPSRKDKFFLRATTPGSTVSFNVKTSNVGRIRVTYLRSKTFGLGSAWCWIGDNKHAGQMLDGWWERDNLWVSYSGSVISFSRA